jgi:hypothetical protein
MTTYCPHCDYPLPAVVDAYCPECRGELEEPTPTTPAAATAPDPPPDRAISDPRITQTHRQDGTGWRALGWLMPFGFNLAGACIFGAAFTVAELAAGTARDGVHQVVFGAAVASLDAAYRAYWLRVPVLNLSHGGRMLWLPIWGFGLLWIGLGLNRLAG